MWSQKYRPKKAADTILPTTLQKIADGIVKSGKIPNAVFAGKPGVGKTTLALAIADELDYETLVLNGSGEDRGIDVVKTKIMRFGTSMSLDGNRKLIIIDEGDNLTQDAQLALRATIETISSNCSIILTCNHPSRLSDAITSRLDVVDFNVPQEQTEKLQFRMFKRVTEILKTEGVDYEPEAVVKVIQSCFPDFRKTLNRLQKYSKSGKIDAEAVKGASASNMDVLLKHLRAKDFRNVLAWTNETPTAAPVIFTWFADNGADVFENDTSWAQCIIDANDHDDKASRVADQKINLVAFLLKVMAKCKLK